MREIIIILMTIFLTGEIMGENNKSILFPEPLKKGDTIAIVAPAGPVKIERVEGAEKILRQQGYVPVVFPTVYEKNGQFSGTVEERLRDMKEALTNPGIRAVICARGGYGAVHILDSLSALPLERDPKWVVGFSDISAIHGLMASKGIASIHGPMALHISRGLSEPENVVFFDMLKGKYPEYTFQPDTNNHIGHAEGKLVGGNFSVIEGLINTPYNLIEPGTILFLEDVGEEIYKLQRMMYQMKLSGVLPNLKGLLLGRFTDSPEGENFDTVEEMMSDLLSEYPELPVAFNIPVGHIRHNSPMIVSSRATLDITPDEVRLKMEPWTDNK